MVYKTVSCLLFAVLLFINTPSVGGSTFDIDLYENVLDKELCERQVTYMLQNYTLLLMTFLDAGARIPRGIFTGTTADFGNYFQCLGIDEEVPEMRVEGKYCLVDIPLQQEIKLPFDVNLKDMESRLRLLNSVSNSRGSGKNYEKLNPESSVELTFSLGICIPKPCTSQDWVKNVLFDVSAIGFDFQEQFCRLPNDKPLVPADVAAILAWELNPVPQEVKFNAGPLDETGNRNRKVIFRKGIA